MEHEAKTKEQLLAELSELRERIAELEKERLERKREDEAPCLSNDQFRAIYEQAPLGIALLDSRTGQFLNVNHQYAEIVGLTSAEMLQLDFKAITHPDDLAADLNNMARLLAGESRSFQMEKRYVRPGR
jgi:PAS domain-containing protein